MKATVVLGATGVFVALQRVRSFAMPRMIGPATSARSSIRLSSSSSTTTDFGIELAKLVQPSVALVTPMGVRKMKTRGSGFVVDFPFDDCGDGENQDKYTYLVTAAHVAAPGFDIGLAFPGDSEDRSATVMGRNQTLDLALLRIDNKVEGDDVIPPPPPPPPPSLVIAQDLPPVGTLAFAHGYPASRLRGPAMTSGIVCGIADGLGLPDSFDNPSSLFNATKDDSTTFVVTDAAMSGGMSGGPLTDSTGKVLGVNALIRPDLRALGNYAVSSEEVICFLKSCVEKERNDNRGTTKTENDETFVGSFQLLLFNDPMNKKQRVSSVLEGVAKMNCEEANKVMMEAHTTGSGVIRIFQNRTQAEDLCQALRKEDLLVEVQ